MVGWADVRDHGVMGRYARWLQRRGGRRWRVGVFATFVVVAQSPLIIATVVVAASFYRLGSAATGRFEIEALLVGATSTAFVVWLYGRTELRTVAHWVAGDESDPRAVFDATVQFQRRALPRVALASLVVVVAEAWHLDRSYLDGSWSTLAALMIGVLGVVFFTIGTMAAWWDVLVAPIRDDCDAHLEASPVQPIGMGVAFRLGAILAFAWWGGGLTTSAIAIHFATHTAQFAAAAVAATAVGLVVSAWVLKVNFVVPLIKNLIRGTERVRSGDYSQRVAVDSADEFGVLGRSFNAMQRGLAERARLQAAFGTYVEPSLAARLLQQDTDVFSGENVHVTCFFMDVRDFTAYAEHATAQQAVERLNDLFELTVPILARHGGHANKFLGDGMLAVFGVPEQHSDHAARAVAAACEIQRAVRTRFGTTLQVGIGINTGQVVAGTVGGGGKLEFTLIGDTVNVAARVEQLTKTTNDPILLSQPTCDALGQSWPVHYRGAFEIRGRVGVTHLYTVSDPGEP